MKRFVFSCLGIVLSYNAFAGGCDWATETPPDDAKYKYFVARTYSDTSATDAQTKAERDIDTQLGRLFGSKLNVQSEFYSDTISADGTTRSYERTIGIITLKGLERQKSDTQKTSGAWVSCVQYRYPKTEITKEKERLNNLTEAEKEQSLMFTEVQGDTQCKGAPVEIVTVPGGAYVTLDNGKYQGTTPIKFGNVCNGKHSLEITKENYVPITQQVIVPTSGRINNTLKRDAKRITVRTSLKNSQIEINGVNKGKEPIVFNAPLGVEQTITAINSEAVKITRTRTFSKDSDTEYVIPMEKLPGKIDFSAFKVRNPGVQITVDGQKVNGDASAELASDIKHTIKLSKEDFVSITENVSVKGGETTYYPSNPRTFGKDNSLWARGQMGLAGLVFVGGTYSNSDIGLNTGVELGVRKRINNTFGVRGGLGVQWLDLDIGKNTLNYNIYKYEFTPLTDNTTCPAGKKCQHASFYQYTSSGGYNDTFWGYFSEQPVVSTKSQEFTWEYNEPLYANLGIIVLDKFYIYGIGAMGILSQGETDYIQAPKTTVFRFGAGIQWQIWESVGLRLQYLTSGKEILSSYKFDSTPRNIGADAREHNKPDYIWLYRQEIQHTTGQRKIDAIESVSLSLFIGF